MPRKKKVFEEEPEEEEYEWDKPRIIGFFVVVTLLVVGGLVFKHFFLDSKNTSSQSVQGVSTQAEDMSLPSVNTVKQGITTQLSNLQKQASQISVQEIASSSPQVQQILQEIKQLPQAPGNIAKQTCMQICNSL